MSASISINGGSYTATSTSISGLGVFQTDAGSAVIDSPEWSHYPGNGVDSNGLTDLAWWINGRNAIWYSPSGVNIGATNVEGNLNPANWSIGDAPSEVPEPSTWLLFGAGLAMAAIRRRNHTRS